MALSNRTKVIFKWLIISIVVFFIGQYIYHTDFTVLANYMQKMPYTFVGLIILSFLGYLSATIAWNLCLGNERGKVGFMDLFMIRHIGEMISIFNPTSIIAGESLKALYLAKFKIANHNSISSIFLSRVLIILAAVLLIIFSAFYLIFGFIKDANSLYMLIASILVLLVFAYLLTRFLLHSKLYVHSFTVFLQQKIGKNIISDDLVHSIENTNLLSSQFYRHFKKLFWIAFILSIIHWIFGSLEFYIIIKSLDHDISIFNSIIIEMGVILFKTIAAVIPGQIGVEEFGNKIMLQAVNIESNEVWLVVSLMRRARQLFWIVIAAIFYMRIKKNIDPKSIGL